MITSLTDDVFSIYEALWRRAEHEGAIVRYEGISPYGEAGWFHPTYYPRPTIVLVRPYYKEPDDEPCRESDAPSPLPRRTSTPRSLRLRTSTGTLCLGRAGLSVPSMSCTLRLRNAAMQLSTKRSRRCPPGFPDENATSTCELSYMIASMTTREIESFAKRRWRGGSGARCFPNLPLLTSSCTIDARSSVSTTTNTDWVSRTFGQTTSPRNSPPNSMSLAQCSVYRGRDQRETSRDCRDSMLQVRCKSMLPRSAENSNRIMSMNCHVASLDCAPDESMLNSDQTYVIR